MKLNKPPFTEKQSALEEYVDFLLTDLSNVTPIRKKKPDNISEVIAETPEKRPSIKPRAVVLKTAEVEKVSTSKPKPSSKTDIKKQRQESELKNLADSETTNNVSIEQSLPATNSIANNHENHPQSLAQDIVASNAPLPESLNTESEDDELKKWDALLAHEKELEIIAEFKGHIETLESVEPTSQNAAKDDLLTEMASGDNRTAPLKSKLSETIFTSRENKEPDQRLASVEKLLARISLATQPVEEIPAEHFDGEQANVIVAETDSGIDSETAQATFLHRDTQKSKSILPEVFQTLIFKVGKLPLAVPLLKLGGIIQVSEQDITPLVATPDWFMGLVANERGNLMVIDTQKFLMPEQSKNREPDSTYEYLIVLDDSNWALACHSVGDAKNLTHDDIRWSEKSSKRPWFGGMVVDYMSALIEVDELINMLSANITR